MKRDNRGFTLVEVIIAIGALGVVCAVLLRLFVLAGDTNEKAGNLQAAQLEATSAAEVFAGSPTIEEALDILGAGTAGTVTGGYTLYRGDITLIITISEEAGDYPGTLYALDIRARADGDELAAITTAKYVKEAQP